MLLYAGRNGRLSKRPSIAWTEAPAAVAYSKPYAVALLAAAVEVIWLQFCHPLIPLPSTVLLS